MFIDCRERGRGERNIDVRETSIGCLRYVPQPGFEPAAFQCPTNWATLPGQDSETILITCPGQHN